MHRSLVTNLQALGLALDILGALVLGLMLALKAQRVIDKEARSYWGYSGPLLLNLATQKLDAIVGTSYLALGFLAQLLSLIGVSPGREVMLPLWVLLPLAACTYFIYRPTLGRWLYRKVLAIRDEEKRNAMSGSSPAAPGSSPGDSAERDRFLALGELAQGAVASRRQYEWKVNLSFWGAIGLLVYASARYNIPTVRSDVEAWILGGFLFLAYLNFQYMISQAHKADKDWKHYYLARAEGLPADSPPRTTAVTQRHLIRWSLSQWILTALLLFFAVRTLLYTGHVAPG